MASGEIRNADSATVRYFEFHAAPTAKGVSAETHGVVPVWGFGTVIKSTHTRIHDGERVYGYLAPTRYLLLTVSPSDVNKFTFAVPRPHLPAGPFYPLYATTVLTLN